VECLLCKLETLSSNSSPSQKKKKSKGHYPCGNKINPTLKDFSEILELNLACHAEIQGSQMCTPLLSLWSCSKATKAQLNLVEHLFLSAPWRQRLLGTQLVVEQVECLFMAAKTNTLWGDSVKRTFYGLWALIKHIWQNVIIRECRQSLYRFIWCLFMPLSFKSRIICKMKMWKIMKLVHLTHVYIEDELESNFVVVQWQSRKWGFQKTKNRMFSLICGP
jgi:hypothetical protein